MPRTLRQVFEALGKKANASSMTFYRQRDWLGQFPEWEKRGACYGIAVGYLIAVRVGLTGADYIGTLDDAAKKKDKGIFKELTGGTGGTEGNGVGTNFYGLQFSKSSRDSEFQAAHMKILDETRFKSPALSSPSTSPTTCRSSA